MQYIEISLDFSAAHFLESEHLHGHNFKVTVKFYGNCNNKGMVIDFCEAKAALDEICNEFDHKVMMSELPARNRKKMYSLCRDDTALIHIPSTTAEYVAEYILTKLKAKFENLKISVELWENHDSSATFFDATILSVCF